MSDLSSYLDGDIARAKRILRLVQIASILAAFVVAMGAMQVSRSVETRMSPDAVATRVGDMVDRKFAEHSGEISKHIREETPLLIQAAAQRAFDASDSYRKKIEDRVSVACVDYPSDVETMRRIGVAFQPITQTRDHLRKLAANKNLTPFEKSTRRSIAVLLRDRF